MASAVGLLLAALALLCAAGALLLWRAAENQRARQATTRRLDAHFRDSGIAADDGPDGAWRPVGSAGAERSLVATPLAARWRSALPDGLVDAVDVRAAGLAALLAGASAALAGAFGGLPAAAGALVATGLLSAFAAGLRRQRRRQRIVAQLPAFLDMLVRLVTIGHSLQSAFPQALAGAREPLANQLGNAAALVRAGVDLDQALAQSARGSGIPELHLLASVTGLGLRYGGRADLVLERMAAFMRDREQAEQELAAMSAETRLSAWVLGLLPVLVGSAIVVLNAGYFARMWADPTGRWLLLGALALQATGAVLLYRLARLD